MHRVRYRAISTTGLEGAGRIRVGLTARPRRVAVRALTSPLDNGRRPTPRYRARRAALSSAQSLSDPLEKRVPRSRSAPRYM